MHDRTGPNARDEAEGGRAERLLPELIKRLVEGIDRFAEGKDMRQRLGELRLPKEVMTLLLAQLEESKNGLYRSLAKELRDFLEQTNFAEELTQALTKLTFEIRTEVRFVPNKPDAKEGVQPEVRAEVSVKRGEKSDKPPEPDAAPESDAPPSGTASREKTTTVPPIPPKED